MERQTSVKAIGRISRLILAAAMLIFIIRAFGRASAVVILGSIATGLGLLIFFTLIHWLITRYWGTINPWLGTLIANGPGVLVFVLGMPGGLIFGRGEGVLAVLLYVGVSLVVAAFRADPGCEVMSLPALIFRRHTQLPCILFSPIDALERKLCG